MVGRGEHRDWPVRVAGDDTRELLWIGVQGLGPSSQDLSEMTRSEVNKRTEQQVVKNIPDCWLSDINAMKPSSYLFPELQC